MTTYIPFVPSNSTAPRFIATFDEEQYIVIATWNVASQRYYLNIYSIIGNWVCTIPLIQTENGVNIIQLTPDTLGNVLKITIANTVWRAPGRLVRFTIEYCQPDDINGTYDCLMLNSNTFTIPMPATRDQINVYGSATRMINMVEGYFKTSRMIYRNNNFEITP
jgi:hypothetical protein